MTTQQEYNETHPRLIVKTDGLGMGGNSIVKIGDKQIKVRGLDVKIMAGEMVGITLYLMPRDLDLDIALLPGAKVWLEDWEYYRRKATVALAEKKLICRSPVGMRLYLSRPIDDTLMYRRVSAYYPKDGMRHGIRTTWHRDTKMTVEDLVSVFTALRDGFVVLDKAALFFSSDEAWYIVRDGALFEQVGKTAPKKIIELPSSKGD